MSVRKGTGGPAEELKGHGTPFQDRGMRKNEMYRGDKSEMHSGELRGEEAETRKEQGFCGTFVSRDNLSRFCKSRPPKPAGQTKPLRS